ncbi:LysE family translocator [Labrenzia sp. CE80]|uniref:LysE family translocator n=1 Tax=Labrenzia sp. CE80 TaxID=1788986 RepID=UPI001389E09A|nr:LysE family translocator [Labrenzia sp. CE80]
MNPSIDWSLWLLTMMPLIFSAGPGNIMVAAAGVQSGFSGSLSFIFGLDLTYFILSMTVGLGLGDLLQAYPSAAKYLSFFGIAYIVYLASRFLRSSTIGTANTVVSFGLKDGMLVQITNTKGVIMLIVMFSEFSRTGSLGHVLILSVALVGLNLVSHLLWASAGGIIRNVMECHPQVLQIQNMIFGIMLLGVAIWLMFR